MENKQNNLCVSDEAHHFLWYLGKVRLLVDSNEVEMKIGKLIKKIATEWTFMKNYSIYFDLSHDTRVHHAGGSWVFG